MRTPFGALGAVAADCEMETDLPATVSVALRAVPGFCAMVYEILVVPLRAPLETVIHDGSPVTDQPQDVPVVTEIVPVRPDGAAEIVRGDTVAAQETPGCVTVNVRPAMVAVPLRCDVAVFAVTTTAAVPGPVLFEPFVTVIHDTLPAPDQRQVLPVDTAIAIVPPAALDVRELGEIVYVQDVAADCVTRNAWPAMVSVAPRVLDAVLAVALKATLPVPVPDPPDAIVIQVTGLLAPHAQPAAAVTVTERLAAEAGSVTLVDDSVGVHVGVNENGFERPLTAVPPGPMAATRAS
jgi:hypothetical protein